MLLSPHNRLFLELNFCLYEGNKNSIQTLQKELNSRNIQDSRNWTKQRQGQTNLIYYDCMLTAENSEINTLWAWCSALKVSSALDLIKTDTALGQKKIWFGDLHN
jgi:23S rRNA A1618 N6-methylase RlmF